MKNTTLFLVMSFSLFFFNSCENDDAVEDFSVGFESATQEVIVPFGSATSTHEVLVTTNVSGTDKFINVKAADDNTLPEGSYSVPTALRIPASTGTVPLVIELIDHDMSIYKIGEVTNLKLEIIEKDSYETTNQTVVLNIEREPCPYPDVQLDILFDDYASETTWEITDSSETVVASGGSYADGQETYTESLCLESGTYTFTINDSYGDGISFPADGMVKITVEGTEVVNITGNFGSSASQSFTF